MALTTSQVSEAFNETPPATCLNDAQPLTYLLTYLVNALQVTTHYHAFI